LYRERGPDESDEPLGIAVREVDGELQARALAPKGNNRIADAALVAYGHELREHPGCGWDTDHTWWTIDPAHRLAFARALSPITCTVESAGVA
jgi:hypothetical protein